MSSEITKPRFNWRLFAFGLFCWITMILCWIPEEIKANQSRLTGEKDLGVGVLAMMAFFASCILFPIGLALICTTVGRFVWLRRKYERAVAPLS